MTHTVVIRRTAKADIAEAHDWYDAQRLGLGREFLDELESCLNRIGERPEAYAVVKRDARRALLRRFPYSVYFRVLDKEIRVLAVIHQRRDPRLLQQRLK